MCAVCKVERKPEKIMLAPGFSSTALGRLRELGASEIIENY